MKKTYKILSGKKTLNKEMNMANKTSTPSVSKKAKKTMSVSNRASPAEMGLDMKRKFPKKGY